MFWGRMRGRWTVTWPIAALCLLVSSRWLLESAHPEIQSSALTEAAGCLAAAALALLGAGVQPRASGGVASVARPWHILWGGAAVVTGPAIAAAISSRHVNADSATLALCLTPVVIAVASPAMDGSGADALTSRLWPGLAGMAGLLLLLPQPSLTEWRLVMALALMPLLVGVGAVAASEEIASVSPGHVEVPVFRSMIAPLLLGAAVFGGLALLTTLRGGPSGFSISASALDGLGALLTLLALLRLGAVRWSAQFLLIPLVTMLEGVLVLRPLLDLRSWLALALLLVSSGYLLFFAG